MILFCSVQTFYPPKCWAFTDISAMLVPFNSQLFLIATSIVFRAKLSSASNVKSKKSSIHGKSAIAYRLRGHACHAWVEWPLRARRLSRTNTRAWVSCEITTLCVFQAFSTISLTFWCQMVRNKNILCHNTHVRPIRARRMLWLMQCCVRFSLLKIIVKFDRLCRDKF